MSSVESSVFNPSYALKFEIFFQRNATFILRFIISSLDLSAAVQTKSSDVLTDDFVGILATCTHLLFVF